MVVKAWRRSRVPSELAEASINSPALQPLAGRVEINEERVSFIPRFPFLVVIVDPRLEDLAGNSLIRARRCEPWRPVVPSIVR